MSSASQSVQATTEPTRGRVDNRRTALLDAAASVFAAKGYHAASMRDIAQAAGMLPGSIYYHFPSKDHLLVAVYEEGVRCIAVNVDQAVAAEKDPWMRLESAVCAHLETLLEMSDHALVLVRVLPEDCQGETERLTALRDEYENRFRELIRALPLPGSVDRGLLRLMLLGALNACPVWRRGDGLSPGEIARSFVSMIRRDSQ